MVALTEFNLEHYERSAALLETDPDRDRDASLQYTYGVALVRSGRADEATRVFSALLTPTRRFGRKSTSFSALLRRSRVTTMRRSTR